MLPIFYSNVLSFTPKFRLNLILIIQVFFCLPIYAQNNTLAAEKQDAEAPQNNCDSTQRVFFNPKTIFDENEEEITFIHRWANAIHIDTKVITLENESAFFLNKCNKNFNDFAELERHLRSQKYIRSAQVSADEMVENITVTTWDNWSLMPTLSFGRKGGVNTYSFGIKERNLLGLGINTEIESFTNNQRSGYKVVTTIPLFQKQNANIKVRFYNNDDGKKQTVFLQKHFTGFYTDFAYNVGFNEEYRHDTIYHNYDDFVIFEHDISYKEASYGWLNYNNKNSLLRYQLGITQNKNIFSELPTLNNNEVQRYLPLNRDFLYPWFEIEYIEKDFRKLTNVHLISQIEDFNHGWQINSRLGLSINDNENSAFALLKTHIKKGFSFSEKTLLLVNLSFVSDLYKHRNNRVLVSLQSEFFYSINKNWGLYLQNSNIFSHNQYLDKPIAIGSESGLRGFPLQYQQGENSVKVTGEIRYYPQVNLFKIFDLAGAVFFDSGKAFGDSLIDNVETSWLYSAGIGARLYSPHSGVNHHVLHIDLAFPLSNNSNINNVEIRIQAKQSF